MPEAERFHDWVVEEVLPRILMTATYNAFGHNVLDAPKPELLELDYERQVHRITRHEETAKAAPSRLANVLSPEREALIRYDLVIFSGGFLNTEERYPHTSLNCYEISRS